DFVEDVEDGIPHFGEVPVSVGDEVGGVGREGVEVRPDGGAGEAGDDFDAEFGGSAGGVLHFFGGAATDAVFFAVAPDSGGEDAFLPLINPVAHRLPDEVVAD